MKHLTWIAVVLALLVVGVPAVSAQTTMNSNGVRLNGRGSPGDVLFTFPTGAESNVDMVQIGCPGSQNGGNVYVYEMQPDGFIATYAFAAAGVECSDSEYTFTLTQAITIETANHKVTILSGRWSVERLSNRYGYYWQATGGTAQIRVQ